jgi:two-component system cell cycle response regulator DivK
LDRKLFSTLFRARGCATLQARNGREVVKLAREHLPDLIVMDIQLPEWSGLEITQRLRADDDLKGIPIVAITALAMEGDRERILDGGCDAYLAKPISVTDFFQTIGQFLG